jgi:hypothetical protein
MMKRRVEMEKEHKTVGKEKIPKRTRKITKYMRALLHHVLFAELITNNTI